METNIQKYMAFVASAEQGSFTKAAESLRYTQSGISRMIADLEKEWNIPLLERSKGGVRLTSDGIQLLPLAKKMYREFEKLQEKVGELNGLQSGLIRIGTISSIAAHRLPGIIKEFQKDFPNVDYELLLGDYTEIEDWILEGRVDCGFVRYPTNPEFETTFLMQDRLLAILPQDHPLAQMDRVPLKELSRQPFMLLEKGAKTEVSEIFERNGLTPQVHFTTWDDYAIMAMVESGLGVSIVPELMLNRIPYRLAVKELDVPAYRKLGLAFRDKKSASRASVRFAEYVLRAGDLWKVCS